MLHNPRRSDPHFSAGLSEQKLFWAKPNLRYPKCLPLSALLQRYIWISLIPGLCVKEKKKQTQNQKNTNKIGLVLDQSIQMHLKKLLKSSTVGQDHYKWHVSNQGTWSLTEEASSFD